MVIRVVTDLSVYPTPFKIPDCTIGEDLSSLLDSSRLSDVTVNVKGKDFHLHQNILAARSAYKSDKAEVRNDINDK